MAEDSNVPPLRTITKALNGSRRDLLIALRDHLWDALFDSRTQPRDLSPLTLRIKELQAEIAAIDNTEMPGTGVKDGPWSPDDL